MKMWDEEPFNLFYWIICCNVSTYCHAEKAFGKGYNYLGENITCATSVGLCQSQDETASRSDLYAIYTCFKRS